MMPRTCVLWRKHNYGDGPNATHMCTLAQASELYCEDMYFEMNRKYNKRTGNTMYDYEALWIIPESFCYERVSERMAVNHSFLLD